MGRGASRSKSGGMTVMKDSERKIIMKNTNISVFEFLQEGCFEKDFMAYCSNRLNDFSCVHWLAPDVSDADPLNQGNTSQSSDETSGPNCYHENDNQSMHIMKMTKFLMPIIIVVAIVTSALIIVSVNRIAYKLFPLASYLIYISLFDIVDLVIRGGDVIIEVYTQTRVLSAIQILTRSSCQMMPFTYSFFKHSHMCLYLAMSIDNWRFVQRPRQMNYAMRSEWIRNVFIIIVAVLLTVNAQFFWTFDVTENENKLLHNRIVKSTLECSFSTTWPLAQWFTEYIWPILDHTAGEILPAVVCIWFGASYFWSGKEADPNLEKYIINIQLLHQMNASISIICFLFGLFSLPRVLYFTFKYVCYLFLKSSNKAIRDKIRSKMEYLFTSSTNYYKEEMYVQHVESFIKYSNIIFIIIKLAVLLRNVQLIKSQFAHLIMSRRPKKLKPMQVDCPKCSEKSCESFLPAITYTHRSVSVIHPGNENVTLCHSYMM